MQIRRTAHFFLFFVVVLSHLLAAPPAIQQLRPIQGPTTGGTQVYISGQNFGDTTSVQFGTIDAEFTILSDSLLLAAAPAIQGSAVTVDVTVTSDGTVVQPNAYTYTAPNWFVYVLNLDSNNMNAIDLSTNTSAALIPVGGLPFGYAITPDGKLGYVSNGEGTPTIMVVDLTTNNIVDTINISPSDACRIAINKEGTRAYLANGEVNNLVVIDITTNTEITAIPNPLSFGRLKDVAISLDSSQAYAADENNNALIVFDLIDNVALGSINLGEIISGPESVAITEDGIRAYVVDQDEHLIPVDIRCNMVLPIVDIPPTGFAIAISKNAYVTGDTTISVVLIPADVIQETLSVGILPQGITITPDSKFAYVSVLADSFVQPIDLTTSTDLPTIPTGTSPRTIQCTPDQAPFALFRAIPSRVGKPSTFDARKSFSPVGSIVSYAWDFGDDSPIEVTTLPLVGHTYKQSGHYEVTLQVTNSAGTSTTQVFTGHTVSNNGNERASLTQTIVLPKKQGCCPMDE